MKRYAIKALKGKEFLQSKFDVIDLGDKSLEVHNKVIEILNDKKILLKDNEVYILMEAKNACFNVEEFKQYKTRYGKKLSLQKLF